MVRTVQRTARRVHWCSCGCAIAKGERYLEHVASPWHPDLGNDRWWRLHECLSCAERYGRGEARGPS
jgi:hypothetical protein